MARSTPGVTNSGDKWYATAYDPTVQRKARVKNPKTGKTAFRTEEEAIDAKLAFERRKDTGANHRWTVGAWAEEWTTNPVYTRPATTTNMHRISQIRPFVAEFANVHLDELTTAMIRGWAHANAHRIPQIRTMFNDAVREEIMVSNPFGRLKTRASKGRKDIKPLTQDEVAELARIAYELFPGWPVPGALVTTAAYTGMRLGELCGLKWEDIDWENGMVTVERQLQHRTNEIVPTKTGNPRTIVMLGQVADALRDVPRANADGFVFHGRRDKGRYNQNLHTYFWAIVRGAFYARLPSERQSQITASLDFHELRHFCGSYLADHGVSAMDIAYQLGHTDGGRLAQQLYIHTYDDHAAERIRRAASGYSGQASGRAVS